MRNISRFKFFALSIFAVIASSLFLFACAVDTADTTGGGGGTTTRPPVTEPQAQRQAFNQHFSNNVTAGFTQTTTVDNTHVTGLDGMRLTYNQMLDRQITLLATDLIYRLTAIWGPGAAAGAGINSAFNLEHNNTNGAQALIRNHSLLMNPTGFLAGNPQYDTLVGLLMEVNINNVATFAHGMQRGMSGSAVSPVIHHALNIQDAIAGTQSGLIRTSTNQGWERGLPAMMPASIGNPNMDFFQAYLSHNLDFFKLGIANIMAGQPSGLGISDYNSALNSINSLVITQAQRTQITNFILNEVIGRTQVADDDQARRDIGTNIIALDTVFANPNGHNYSVYRLLVPAVVNQALDLTFDGTTQSVFVPNVARQTTSTTNDSVTLTANQLNNRSFTSVQIIPNNQRNLTQLFLTTTSNVAIRFEIVRPGMPNVSGTVNAIANQEATLNFAQAVGNNSATIGSDGHILLTFTNVNGPFNITFNGYMDRN